MGIITNIPYTWAVKLGGVFTGLLWDIGIRKDIARTNFEIVFGNRYTHKERDVILRKSYVNFGRSMSEFMRLPLLSSECLLRLVNMSRAQDIAECAQKKQGALLVTGHFGSWELLGAALVANNWPIDYLVGKQSNKKIEAVMNDIRIEKNIGIIQMGIASRGILNSIKNGRMVALLSDQDAGRAGIEVTMFDKKVMTPGGTAAFAIKTGAPIIIGVILRNDDIYTHSLLTEKLIMPELTGDKKEDIANITQAYTDKVAKLIENYPELWFWPHRRFKRVVDY